MQIINQEIEIIYKNIVVIWKKKHELASCLDETFSNVTSELKILDIAERSYVNLFLASMFNGALNHIPRPVAGAVVSNQDLDVVFVIRLFNQVYYFC